MNYRYVLYIGISSTVVEVWPAEEQEEEQEQEVVVAINLATPTGNASSDVQDGKQLSLLDQFLAMILATLPVDPDRQSLQEHYQFD
jgi:hypothetical protein